MVPPARAPNDIGTCLFKFVFDVIVVFCFVLKIALRQWPIDQCGCQVLIPPKTFQIQHPHFPQTSQYSVRGNFTFPGDTALEFISILLM